MRRTDLQELTNFVAVARERSFRRAAAELGMSPSALSHALRSLEDRLGVKLLNRTTRSVSLTDAGSDLMARIEPAFQQIDEAIDVVQETSSRPQGRVRLSVPNMAAHLILAPVMGQFSQLYPDVVLEVSVNDAAIDIVDQRFDAGIRLHESVPRDMVAVLISPPLRGIVVGSPAYLKDHSAPLNPSDLTAHRCISYRYPSSRTAMPWDFAHIDHGEMEVVVAGPIVTDDMDLMIEAAVQGVGLAFVLEARALNALAGGSLVQVLDDWCAPHPGFCIYYPVGRYMSAGLRALIDHLLTKGVA
ncbi:MAG: LysR family transcriptional regulator [Rhizobium sp.]|nr:MAG: LysR family transcriptional regulator [Rhizobium sp.]